MKEINIHNLKSMPLDQIIRLYQQGYRLNENVINKNVRSMAATCQVSSKVAGDIVHLSSTPSGGTPPYTVNIYKDGTAQSNIIRQFTYVASGQAVTHDYTTTTADVGSHTFSTICWDSCPGNPQQSLTSSCPITITSAQGCTALAGCTVTGPATVVTGQNTTFTVSWTGGKSPYSLSVYDEISSTPYATLTGISGTSTQVTINTNTTGTAVGSHTLYAFIDDGCSPVQNCTGSIPVTFAAPTSGAGYNCVSAGNCQYVTSSAQYTDQASCLAACTAGGGGGLLTCTPPCGPTQMCLLGSCLEKKYLTYGALGFGAVILLAIMT